MSEPDSSITTASPFLFYSVSEAASILRISEMTLYRQIRAKQFPAIRVSSRLVIPAQHNELMAQAAVIQNSVVDAAEWISIDKSTSSASAEL